MSIHFFPAGQIPPSGSANVGDVRSGKTFTSGSGSNLTGTLAEAAGGNTITPGTAAIQAIAANTIANAAIQVAGDANLVGGNIKPGVTIFGVASTMPNVAGGNTITPNTAAQTAINAGTYATNAISVAGDANLVAANILSGLSIFGVAGSATPRKYASGTVTSSGATAAQGGYSLYYVTVSGLNFQPNIILVMYNPSNLFDFTVYQSVGTFGVSGTTNQIYSRSQANGWAMGSPDYVNSSGFELPIGYGNASCTWFAWQ